MTLKAPDTKPDKETILQDIEKKSKNQVETIENLSTHLNAEESLWNSL